LELLRLAEARLHEMFDLKTFLLEFGIILLTARCIGWLFRKIHQPRVMGEMVAGILLGPTLLGSVWPNSASVLFPASSLGYLEALSQLGLVLFMFRVGLELDTDQVHKLGRKILLISNVSVVVPFIGGAALACYLYPRLADHSVPILSFSLFIGAAMSITAFPVLARILVECNLLRTRIGSIAIACAAVDDVTAWCILAVITVLVRAGSSGRGLGIHMAELGLYAGIMIWPLRHFARRMLGDRMRLGYTGADMFAGIIFFAIASSWVTDQLGVHPLFGAFMAGVILPKSESFMKALASKFQPVQTLLLPLFFALTGLRTSFRVNASPQFWLYATLILVTAIAGKFIGCAIAARATGLTWRESITLGALLNTRGLVELVILNIGLDLNVISPAVFSMMVLMTLVTTLITAPVLHWVRAAEREPDAIPANVRFLSGLPRETRLD
jgi:Kef-type K+ transport system membrane component KefB